MNAKLSIKFQFTSRSLRANGINRLERAVGFTWRVQLTCRHSSRIRGNRPIVSEAFDLSPENWGEIDQ